MCTRVYECVFCVCTYSNLSERHIQIHKRARACRLFGINSLFLLELYASMNGTNDATQRVSPILKKDHSRVRKVEFIHARHNLK